MRAGGRVGYGLVLIGVLIVLTALTIPSWTLASEVSVQTVQLLPPGSNTCTQAVVSGFTPYVYDGTLHALEFTVSDSSYVAIIGAAGSTGIPFNQITRRIEQSGAVRIHADVATTQIRGSLPVAVTLLSAKTGQPVCISVVSTSIAGEGAPLVTPPAPIPSPTPTGGTSGVTKPKPSTGGAAATPPPKPSAGLGKDITATGTKATSAAVAAAQTILKDICSSAAGALRLWVILLLAYALIALIAIAGQPQMPPALRTQEWIAAAIVVPFLLLFGLWYFVESCRTSPWIPVIATVIALVGLSAAFWERKDTSKVINLPGAKT
ncbi:hypothetical protein A3A39_00660 [Candidatus Kaiserbacteria bacterium RIFCSPLOWO2_01_FULL_54_13]|uniref:Uncharacterized protein n=1 Tax=Candidatus Kaiserbacteria bacterium RIFCSPLOWO2_01_FULL_54_13 TaxID=1798512 RepID=A0A1F6EZQ9_9BACT|nr:MAG: hypothetical protein A3A39_00660 [Candidatus Kaiserbacteria bacterium RIFCSPLOWO2_01_FULL_54_13]